MATVTVRCTGRPVAIADRESPTEYDMEPSCGFEARLDDWSARIVKGETGVTRPVCPECGGVLEPVETSGAEAVVSATTTPTMRGRSASAPEHHIGRLDLEPIRKRWVGATEGAWEALVLGSEGYAIRPRTGDMRKRARIAMCGYRAWEEDRANAEFIAASWADMRDLLNEADAQRTIELAAVALLRASGPGASFGEHETAERALRDLLTARGHDLGEDAE
jgi:hypothetical protein